MKKLQEFIGNAPNISNTGNVSYCLWLDDSGSVYMQITNNSNSGTHSDLLFSVSNYAPQYKASGQIGCLNGYDLADQTSKSSNNNNDGPFLKAILAHMLP